MIRWSGDEEQQERKGQGRGIQIQTSDLSCHVNEREDEMMGSSE